LANTNQSLGSHVGRSREKETERACQIGMTLNLDSGMEKTIDS